MQFFKFIALILCINLSACASAPKNTPKPKTVNEASDILIDMLSNEDREALKQSNKQELIDYHMGLGKTIRNDFGLWGDDSSLLKDCGVSHPDDCSHIIIEDAWKKLRK
jgi:hypothetical protein